VADEELKFPVEDIPDSDVVYRRAHRSRMRDGKPTVGVFTAVDGGMSVAWSKYSSAEESHSRSKNPHDNAIVELSVGDIRNLVKLQVDHAPEASNRSHSNVILPDHDENYTEARTKLGRLATVVITLPS